MELDEHTGEESSHVRNKDERAQIIFCIRVVSLRGVGEGREVEDKFLGEDQTVRWFRLPYDWLA